MIDFIGIVEVGETDPGKERITIDDNSNGKMSKHLTSNTEENNKYIFRYIYSCR